MAVCRCFGADQAQPERGIETAESRQQARLSIQHGKGDKQRAVYVGEVARKALWKHLQTRPDARPGDALFNTARGGHLTRQNLRKMIAAAGVCGCVQNAGVRASPADNWRL